VIINVIIVIDYRDYLDKVTSPMIWSR